MQQTVEVGILVSTEGTYQRMGTSTLAGLCHAIAEINDDTRRRFRIEHQHYNPAGRLEGYAQGIAQLIDGGARHIFGTTTSASRPMAVVERLCHRVAVMFAGRILEIGSREQVLNNPCHAYTKRLLAAVPIPALDSKLAPVVMSKDTEIVDPIRARGEVLQPIRYEQPEAGHFVAVAV